MSAAVHLLEKNGEFYPFAISLDEVGAPGMEAADPGEGEHPSSHAVLSLCASSDGRLAIASASSRHSHAATHDLTPSHIAG